MSFTWHRKLFVLNSQILNKFITYALGNDIEYSDKILKFSEQFSITRDFSVNS